jgi:amino acid adenylation domain-containing protein
MDAAPDFIRTILDATHRRPEHVAVVAHDGRLDYATLDRRANQLAHHLIALGVGREARVGISWPRGANELVAMLAVVKAGAAYVPLVTTYPRDRLRMIVEDAAPEVVFVHPSSPLADDALRPGTRRIDDLETAAAGEPTTPPAVAYDPDQLVYVMFTSGSTGRPKGVEITRGAFSNFLRSMAHTPGLDADDRLLAITTTGFDIAGLELFLPLYVGATVEIAASETARDPRLLRRRLEQGGITTMQATPAMWRLLLDAGWTGDGRLRMLCGGEAMPAALARRLLAAGGELWNLYGPTETTVWSTLARIPPDFDRITIGAPIDATQIYLLDASGRPSDAAEGELGIGGTGVARGYRGLPRLTADRFVALDGDRVYRTGDLARRLDDGRIEWLGRIDQQIKIAGNRVEVGEIEATLRAVPGVHEARVFADTSAGDEPRLVAYWIGDASRDALVAAARRGLPGYMVPSCYVPIDAFPLNPNGKVDAKLLPRPERLSDRRPDRRTMNDVEARIAAIWREVLGTDDVPVDEDFFTLGGTSVLATAAILRIEQAFGTSVSMRCFFEARTVERLAAALGTDAATEGPVLLSLRHGRSDRAPLFCLVGLDVYQPLAHALAGDRDVIGAHVPLRYVPGRDARPELTDIAEHYVSLLRTRQPHGPYHLLGLCFGGIIAYEVARLLEAQREQVASVTVIDATLPTAVHAHLTKRVRTAVAEVRRALREPGELERWARRRGESLAGRLGVLRRLREATSPYGASIELPIDGPEVDRQIREFARNPGRLRSRLLIVRATAAAAPEWMEIDRHLGWDGRAREVQLTEIAADHLGVLREPHVQALARVLREVAPD